MENLRSNRTPSLRILEKTFQESKACLQTQLGSEIDPEINTLDLTEVASSFRESYLHFEETSRMLCRSYRSAASKDEADSIRKERTALFSKINEKRKVLNRLLEEKDLEALSEINVANSTRSTPQLLDLEVSTYHETDASPPPIATGGDGSHQLMEEGLEGHALGNLFRSSSSVGFSRTGSGQRIMSRSNSVIGGPEGSFAGRSMGRTGSELYPPHRVVFSSGSPIVTSSGEVADRRGAIPKTSQLSVSGVAETTDIDPSSGLRQSIGGVTKTNQDPVSFGDRPLFPNRERESIYQVESGLRYPVSGTGNSASLPDIEYPWSDSLVPKRPIVRFSSDSGTNYFGSIKINDPIGDKPRYKGSEYGEPMVSAFRPVLNPSYGDGEFRNRDNTFISEPLPGVYSTSGGFSLPRSVDFSGTAAEGLYSNRPRSTFTASGQIPSDESRFHLSQPIYQPRSQPSADFMALSDHMLEAELLKKGIEKYSGVAHRFWPWRSKLEEYLKVIRLNPRKILAVLESSCEGEPLRVIQNYTAACGAVTMQNLEEVWEELANKFGHPNKITRELSELIREYPQIKGEDIASQLEGLVSLCRIIRYNRDKCPDLACYDYGMGTEVIRRKLPVAVQKNWGSFGREYESRNGRHPPFNEFVNFLKREALSLSNSSYDIVHAAPLAQTKRSARVLSTIVEPSKVPSEKVYDSYKEKNIKVKQESFQDSKGGYSQSSPRKEPFYRFQPAEEKFCIFCPARGHKIHNCFRFRDQTYQKQQEFMKEKNLCFRCLGRHRVETCRVNLVCYLCKKDHATAFHNSKFKNSPSQKPKPDSKKKAESTSSDSQDKEEVMVRCTRVVKSPENVSYSKTLLVEISMAEVPDKKMTAYAIIDEQSDRCLVDDRVLEFFGKDFPTVDFSMKVAVQDCELNKSGKLVSGLMVRGKLEDEIISLPETLSCQDLTDTVSEVASPEVVLKNESTAKYAQFFPELEPAAPVLLLIGRDCGRAMATECLTQNEPYVHKTPLGFSLVGCIQPRSSLEEDLHLRVLKTSFQKDYPVEIVYKFPKNREGDFETFQSFPDDDQLGFSQDEVKFFDIVQPNTKVTPKGNIEIPLPTRDIVLPKNEGPVYYRTKRTTSKLLKEPDKLEECIKSMQKSIDNEYVEEVPLNEVEMPSRPTWYLPIFCVEQKKKSLRLVYDASAKYGGISLNDALYQGPDLNNQLRNVLLRFRERPIAFAADIQSMFNNFSVPEDQKDLMRFFWFKQNDPEQEIVPYRSTCHIFGCASSPAICTFGLKYCASHLPAKDEAREYLERNFYVDDGLFSSDTATSAIDILARTTSLLKSYGMKLHKIISNSPRVLESFPDALRSVSLTTLPSENPSCSALGVQWNTENDRFVLLPDLPSRPFTKRGILSTINSLFDPLGMVSPVLLQGRLMQREILSNKKDLSKYDWDDNLPQPYFQKWSEWLLSLDRLAELSTPRSFFPEGFAPIRQELHVFSDASQKAIGYVAYIRSINKECESHVSFVTASSKLAPKASTTIPRLELNAAVEACKAGFKINSELRHKPDAIYFHTDSQIVLGYLKNQRRRFSKYIERRVTTINNLFPDSNWSYIGTKENPADHASRPCSPGEILSGNWLGGPAFLWDTNYVPEDSFSSYEPPTSLPEEVLEVSTKSTQVDEPSPFSNLFKRVVSFPKLVNIMKIVLKFVRRVDLIRERKRPSADPLSVEVTNEEAQTSLVKVAQKECFASELASLKSNNPLPDSNKLSNLSPVLDREGIIRVGGRLKNADIAFSVKHPILIPEKHPLSAVMIEHYHKLNKHQGSHITHNSIIQNGFHIQNGRRLIRNLLNACVTCRKLRAKTSTQFMADLPSDRLSDLPPFTHVGMDVFGPFYIHDGKSTRSTKATKKIWALIIVCLPSRAVHLEYLPGMDTPTFWNAFKRFQAIRGPCKTIRSDQGSNFMLAKKQMEALDISAISAEFEAQGIKWTLNSPHASHQGGAWERKIGSVRRVLEATFELISHRGISRDEFITFLAEAASVVNNTPLWVPSYDPNDPTPLTPQMILTLRQPSDYLSPDNYSEDDILAYGSKRYRRVQFLASQFWRRWRTEYLHTLTTRQKWRKASPPYKEGDVVLIKDKNLARNAWPLGRVRETKPSSDGLVRKVILTLPPLPGRTSTRSVERAVTDLVLLLSKEAQPGSDSVQEVQNRGGVSNNP